MEFGEKTLKSQQIFDGSLIQVEKQIVRLQNGNTAERELVHHGPAVAIVACDDEGRLIMVKQYRKAIEKAILEVPAGLIDPGEDRLAAAKREFEEETAYQAKYWEELDGFYLSPGYLDEFIQLYWAEDLKEVENPLPQDADEHIEVFHLTLDEAKAAVSRGDIVDAKTIYAIQVLEIRQLRNESRGQ